MMWLLPKQIVILQDENGKLYYTVDDTDVSLVSPINARARYEEGVEVYSYGNFNRYYHILFYHIRDTGDRDAFLDSEIVLNIDDENLRRLIRDRIFANLSCNDYDCIHAVDAVSHSIVQDNPDIF